MLMFVRSFAVIAGRLCASACVAAIAPTKRCAPRPAAAGKTSAFPTHRPPPGSHRPPPFPRDRCRRRRVRGPPAWGQKCECHAVLSTAGSSENERQSAARPSRKTLVAGVLGVPPGALLPTPNEECGGEWTRIGRIGKNMWQWVGGRRADEGRPRFAGTVFVKSSADSEYAKRGAVNH